ncbi:hypothetical protein FRB95_008892 [Tulasnella sp. JGI-2019a]|nr:hypothetical protein FRB95_008892 [Tulasnella sp. JGI-2019a]
MSNSPIVAQLIKERTLLNNLADQLCYGHQLRELLDTTRKNFGKFASQRISILQLVNDFEARSQKDKINDYDPSYACPLIPRRDILTRAHDVITEG